MGRVNNKGGVLFGGVCSDLINGGVSFVDEYTSLKYNNGLFVHLVLCNFDYEICDFSAYGFSRFSVRKFILYFSESDYQDFQGAFAQSIGMGSGVSGSGSCRDNAFCFLLWLAVAAFCPSGGLGCLYFICCQYKASCAELAGFIEKMERNLLCMAHDAYKY